jgi:hypothetical protein
MNVTSATALKSSLGRLVRVNVVVAGSTVGTANDCATGGSGDGMVIRSA